MYTRYYDAVITYKMEQLLQREKLHPDNVTRGFKPRNDTNCIRTIEQFKNSEGHFIIPPDNILEALPINVVDCLYHRITSTIQAFCAKRRRHGTMNDGWNICEDGCYKPNKNTSTWVISTVNDKMNAQSMDLHYNIKVYRHKPSLKSGETETDVIPKDANGLFKHSTKFGVWSDEVKRRSNDRDVFILDVDALTDRVLSEVIENGLLKNMQQLSVRINYSDSQTGIKYLSALRHLRTLFQIGFRIYWSMPQWPCILKKNKNRTSCVYLDMIYHACKEDTVGGSQYIYNNKDMEDLREQQEPPPTICGRSQRATIIPTNNLRDISESNTNPTNNLRKISGNNINSQQLSEGDLREQHKQPQII
ncbi:Hypothetical predicted protein [Mytilus galloprovincialis]|nr:Hypothetical predicted protein [Mytilus galloprovincialis]